MYCSQCSQPIQPQQAHCTVCGAPTGLSAGPGVPPAPMYRVTRHLHTLGILWAAYAAYVLLGWMVAVTFLHGLFGMSPMSHGWTMGGPWMMGHFPFFVPWLLPLLTVFLVLRALLSLAVGVALLTRQSWGRTFAIVMAVLTVFKLFLGTALAVYTFWVMFAPNAQQEYEQIAANANAGR